MRALGLDIGTSKLSAVVVNLSDGSVLRSLEEKNQGNLHGAAWERLQDPQIIWAQANKMVAALWEDYPDIGCIGLTGQMHGILYVDERGEAASPLFTWQDGRGDQVSKAGQSYAELLSAQTGKRLATGYGAVTHDYLLQNGLVPPKAVSVATIADYIAMRLTRRKEPLLHVSNADSLGAPEWKPLARLLQVTGQTALCGETEKGIPVAVAIGDNQASFIGSVQDANSSVLVNMGTGGQISLVANRQVICENTEARPYVDGRFLWVGFSLCGGRAYALLERLFTEIAGLGGAACPPMYEAMNRLAGMPLADPLEIHTQFSGTRAAPGIRGSIVGLSTENLTAAHLVQGVLHGMAEELHTPYLQMLKHMEEAPSVLIGAGNGIRKNPALRTVLSRRFGMELKMPGHQEEAAYGAALFALVASQKVSSLEAAQRRLIHLVSAI